MVCSHFYCIKLLEMAKIDCFETLQVSFSQHGPEAQVEFTVNLQVSASQHLFLQNYKNQQFLSLIFNITCMLQRLNKMLCMANTFG